MVDPGMQAPLRDWLAAAGEQHSYPTMIVLDKPAMMQNLKSFAGQYDVIVVDGCPKSMGMIAAMETVADVVRLPMQPSGLDL